MATIEPYSFKIAQELLTCLCSALNDNFVEDPTLVVPGECCIRPGVDIPLDVSETGVDACCVGEAYVKINSVFPSASFPEPDPLDGVHKCQFTRFTVSLEIGVIRCISWNANCEEREFKARLLTADHQAMLAAACCWGKILQTPAVVGRGTRWSGGEWVPFGPDGGCIGGTMQLFASIPGNSCCT